VGAGQLAKRRGDLRHDPRDAGRGGDNGRDLEQLGKLGQRSDCAAQAGQVIGCGALDDPGLQVGEQHDGIARIEWCLIGIGANYLDPSHTTRHAGPHRAVREVEVM